MQLTEFVSKPTPKQLSISTPDIIEAYGEPLEFYINSPMPMESFLTLSNMTPAEFLKEVLINADGTKAIPDGMTLPIALSTAVATEIWSDLGKLPGKN